MIDRKTMGAWIKRRREAAKLTQAALGARVKLTQSMVHRLERGGAPMSFERWTAFCEAFRVDEQRAIREIIREARAA